MNVIAPVTALILAMMMLASTLLTSYFEKALWQRDLRTRMLNEKKKFEYEFYKADPENSAQNDPVIDDDPNHDDRPPNDNKNSPKGNKPQSRLRTNGHLNINPLFAENGKESPYYELLKQLIEQLYSKQDFFIETQAKIPDLTVALLAELIKHPKVALLKQSQGFSSFELSNPLLHEVWVKMIRGCQNEAYPGEGYPSIKDFIIKTKPKGDPLINIYLCPRELLQVIFQNDEVVKDICKERKAFHSAVTKKGEEKKTAEKASAEFKCQFESAVLPSFSSCVEFTVTTTQPPK